MVIFYESTDPVGVYEVQAPRIIQADPFHPHLPDKWLSHDN